MCTTRHALAALCALAAGFTVGVPQRAHAQNNAAERADELNEQGKDRFREGDLAGALKKFRQAIVFSPEGRFYFNVCYVLERQGKYSEALTACKAVVPNGADQRLEEKTSQLIATIRQKMPARDPGTGDPGTGDPGTGDPGTGDPGTGDPGTGDPGDPADPYPDDPPPPGDPGFQPDPNHPPPPDAGEVEAPPKPAMEEYRWSLGIGVAALGSSLEGYANGGGQVQLHADFILWRKLMLGIAPYINLASIGADDPTIDQSIGIIDLGVAAFKHFRLGRRINITPLAGVHFSLMQPESLSNKTRFATGGARAEIQVALGLGSRQQHVLSLSPTVNVYFPASGESSGFMSSYFGLDETNATYGVAFGYSYRFATAFGKTPLFTLE